jgi:hypothetical protein
MFDQTGDKGDNSWKSKHSPYGIANVLLLNGAKQHHRVTYDSEDRGGVFQVHTNEGIVEFKPSARGLHYHDVSDASSNIELMLVNTVRKKLKDTRATKSRRPRKHVAFKA